MKQIKTIRFPNDKEPREIVDAQARAEIEYLKNNTTVEETDPTVPAWAKEPSKPTYTADEVGALPNTTVIPSIDGLATETYVDNKVASMVDSAPETLDTLNELAAALGDDPNFATTIVTQLGNKAEKDHSHQTADISDFPESLPASDVYDWAKQENPPIVPTEEIVNSAVVYVKDVPADSAPHAEVKEIGGMTRKCANLLVFEDKRMVIEGKGITADIKDGVITLTGTSIGSGGKNSRLSAEFLLNPGTYFFSVSYIGAGFDAFCSSVDGDAILVWGNNSFTITEPTLVYASINVVSEVDYTNTKIFMMLNEGSTALPYEPYFDGLRSAPVTGLESVGANLFDKNTIVKGSICGSDGSVYGNEIAFYSEAISVAQGVTYTVQGYNWYNFYTDSNTPSPSNFAGQSAVATFTPPSNAKFVRLIGDLVNLDAVMLNKGDTALPYESYTKTTLPIPEAIQNLDGYGWGINESVYNYIDLDKKQFVKRVGCVDLGTLIFQESGSAGGWYAAFAETIIPNIGLCDAYSVVSTIALGNAPDKSIQLRNDGKLYIRDLTAVTGSDIKGMLYYELAEPIITDITDLMPDNLIKVQDGGTVTMVNEYGYDVPNTLRFCTGNNEVIGADVFVGDLHGIAKRAEVSLDVPDWAKQPTKPKYTAEEVGARPNTWTPTPAEIGAARQFTYNLATGTAMSFTFANDTYALVTGRGWQSGLEVAFLFSGYGPGGVRQKITPLSGSNNVLYGPNKEGSGHGFTIKNNGSANLTVCIVLMQGSAPTTENTDANAESLTTCTAHPIWNGGTGANDAETARANLGAAPAGYGLGDSARSATGSLDNITMCGWYYYNTASITNVLPAGITHGWMEIFNRNGAHVYQRITDINHLVIERVRNATTWTEWEWVNPPMSLGVEYRTTERMNGNAVYKKNDNGVIKYRIDGETEWKDYAPVYNAAPTSHGTHVSYGTSASALGTSSAGSATTVSRSDHVHALPALTSCTGTLSVAKGGTGATNAATARTNLGIKSETWTFKLKDGSTVTKVVYVG